MSKGKLIAVASLSLLSAVVYIQGITIAAEGEIPPGAYRVAKDHFDRAIASMQRRNFHYARGDFNFVLRIKWDTGLKAPSYLNLGIMDFIEGNVERAIKHYQSALEIKPDYPEAYFNIGTAYFRQGKLQDAERAFLKTIELDPRYGRAHYSLGVLYFDQKKYDLAREHADRAAEFGVPYETLKEKLQK